MLVMETVYLCGDGRPAQLTPNNYWRRNTNCIPGLDGMESQLRAEFTGYSDFNKLVDEKFVEIL